MSASIKPCAFGGEVRVETVGIKGEIGLSFNTLCPVRFCRAFAQDVDVIEVCEKCQAFKPKDAGA